MFLNRVQCLEISAEMPDELQYNGSQDMELPLQSVEAGIKQTIMSECDPNLSWLKCMEDINSFQVEAGKTPGSLTADTYW